MQSFDAAATARLLDIRRLMASLETVLAEYQAGLITTPQRLIVRCGSDQAGVLLSMPCAASDLVSHKLITVFAGNPHRGLPAIQGQVTAWDGVDGRLLFTLDGPTVTARRTAAISMIGIARLRAAAPANVAIIGTGAQAQAHVDALRTLYPDALIRIRGTSPEREQAFCAAQQPGPVVPQGPDPVDGDVVIAATSSLTPVYDADAEVRRLVIGVGAFRLDMVEVGSRVISGSQVYVDDPVGAPAEAGDVAAAGIPWETVEDLANALTRPPDFTRPIVFKSVGCGAWDLAACRTARDALGC